jgi:DsbC/DsbD-like thiol-disulfide interchange protein
MRLLKGGAVNHKDLSPTGRRRKKSVYAALFLATAAVCLAGYFVFERLREASKSHSPEAGPQVLAELVAGTDAIVPGQEFLVGVHFRIAEGWHIYHREPGDAGLPTSVDLQLPSGFVAGQVLYPRPVQFRQPGDIVGYGYKDEVMLLVPVMPPPDLKPGQSVTLQANTQWLACREICVLGERKMEQALPVASNANFVRKELFEKWMQQVPSDSEARAEGAVFSCNPHDEGESYECKSEEAVAGCDSHAALCGLRPEEQRIRKG